MRNCLKKTLSLILTIGMLLSCVSLPAVAIFDTDFSLSSVSVEVDGTEDKTVSINLTIGKAATIYTLQGNLAPSAADGKIIMDTLSWPITNQGSLDYINPLTGNFKYSNAADGTDFNAGDAVITATYTVAKDTPEGLYTVDLTNFLAEDDDGTMSGKALTATITVKAPSSAPAYELYYTLDSTAEDTDSDEYKEYNPGDTVTATVYLKANAADTLQAFDLYVTNDSNLTYTNYTSAYGTRIASGSAASTATSQHIQAIGASKESPINVTLPAGEGVEIAKLTFTVANAAIYNTGLPITISDASNIAVANTPVSFTPERQTTSSSTLGAETLKTYAVSYNAGEGTGAPADQTKQHNVALTLSTTEPTRTGYTFQGWTKTSGSTTVDYAKGASFTENADTTLYAVWQANTHTVIWKSQDGATTLETDNDVAYGTTLSYDGTEPSKDADAEYTYTFVGWSETANAETGAAANTFTMGDSDITLYAAFSKETKKYTVTWKNEDGTVLETDNNVPYGTTPSYDGATPTKAADDTYTYTFNTWSPAVVAVTGDATYTATYTSEYKDYTITYALGDHPAEDVTAPTADSKHYGDKITLPAGPNAADGYTFSGWSDGTNTYNAGTEYTVSGTATLTAQYTENKYNVVYSANEGTGTVPVSHNNVDYTGIITISGGDSLSRTGYTFAGWNTKSDGTGTDYSAGATVSKLSAENGATVTLYAKWTTAAYTIEYNYDGGTVETDNVTSYDVKDLPITLNVPTKTGYTFDSWTIAVKDGESGNVTTSGNVIDAGTYGNLTVKANWTPAEVNYTVKHFQQNLDNDDYTEVTADTQTLTGTTGTQTAALVKTYTGFTAKSFTQSTIEADGSTTVSIYYDRNLHKVTYAYTGTVPTGAPAVPDQITNVKYGATVTLTAVNPTLDHYTFSGWSQTGTLTMADADVSITGSWSEKSYTIKFWNLEEGESGNTVLSEQTYTESTRSNITVPEVPAKSWYDANGWMAYTLFSADEINVYPQYTKHTYTITFQDENGDALTDQGTDHNFDIDDKTITPPAVPEKPGYTGAWPTLPTNTPEDASVKPVYTANKYTITFETDGGTAITAMTYTIESTTELPSATGKTNYSFENWKVTTPGGNWDGDATINGGTQVKGKYGNVTLTAQWTVSLSYALEEYKYAPAGYKLLLIDAAGAAEGNVYKYDGADMYYIADENNKVGNSTAVFYTLVQESSFSVDKIAASEGTQQTITYNGDINGDGKVNIADANAIFQMVAATGTYYSTDQLNIAQRLAADMVKSTDNTEHRGSIEDVNAVVALINGTN